jgi:hypothetical protein
MMIRPAVLATALLLSASSALGTSCDCGYTLTQYNNAYFRHLINADFATTSLSGTATGPDWLSQYGLGIADGWQSGSRAKDGTSPVASYKNVRVQDGALQLLVPGGQTAGGGTMSVAEIDGPSGMIGGVLTLNAKIDPTPGTCQSIVRSLSRGRSLSMTLTRTPSLRTTTAKMTRTSRTSRF